MRSFLVSCAALVAIACGSQPKTAATTSSAPPAEPASTAPSAAPSAAPVPPEAPAPKAPPPPVAAQADELSPPKADDPWLAHRQIPPDVVVKTLKPIAVKVGQCFKEGLKRDPTIEGEVRIRFVIVHEGNVVDFKDDNSEMPDHEVVSCIGGVIKTVKFPEPPSPGGAYGVYSTHLSK